MLFTISDLHLSFGSDKPMDVFHGWENYTEKLAENWCAKVSPEDYVVLPGDTSWAMSLSGAQKDFAYLHALPGTKLILKGNHDFWWTTRKKMEDFFSENGFYDLRIVHNDAFDTGKFAVCGTRGWLYNAESEEDHKIVLREAGRLETSVLAAEKTGKPVVAFLHYPPVYENRICTEILEVLKKHKIKDCYFGHIHGKIAAKGVPQGEYGGVGLHLIAADQVGFSPVLIG